MKNKNIWLISAASLFVALAVASCTKNFLNVLPTQVLTTGQLATQKGINEMLIGAYADLSGQFNGTTDWQTEIDNWLYGSVCGGDAHKGSDPGDQVDAMAIANFSVIPSNSYLELRWQWLYDGITRSNNVMNLLPQVKGLDPADTMNIYAQAKFLRGLYSFYAVATWGMVPWVDQSISYGANNYHVPNNTNIYPNVEADFQFAYQNLPATQPSVGMANKYAAGAFLAKVYMYEGKYSQALPILQDLINNGETSGGLKYALQPKFSMNFSFAYNNSSEAVFSYQASLNTAAGGAQGNMGDMLNYPYGNGAVTGCCGFFQPSIELVNTFRTDANGLPLLGGSASSPEYDLPANAVKNDEGIPSTSPFTPDQGNLDPRLDWTAGRRGIPYYDWGIDPGMDWIRNQGSAGPYSPKKNVFSNAELNAGGGDNSVITWAPLNSINYNLIRFAQVLLWAAECEVQAGNLDQAETYVNMVRTRAANPADFVMNGAVPAAHYVISPYPAGAFDVYGKDKAMYAVQTEEKLELAMEGQRFFDLVRWGDASDVINHYFQYEGQFTTDIRGAKFSAPTNNVWPIPQQQIDLSSNSLKQNPGYR